MAINTYRFINQVTVNPVLAAGTTTGTGTITAGAGSATLAAGVPVTGFALSFSAAPSTTGTATLTNVAGAPIAYDVPVSAAPFIISLPEPIAATAGNQATLTIAGLGTGAGVIELYGQGIQPGDPGTGGAAGYGSSATITGDAPWPTTFLKGQLIALDPTGPLYAAINGGTNLVAVTVSREQSGGGSFYGTSN